MRFYLISFIACLFMAVTTLHGQNSSDVDPLISILEGEEISQLQSKHRIKPSDDETPFQVYDVPLASRGNSIELTVSNPTEQNLEELSFKIAGMPKWIKMKVERKISQIPAQKEVTLNYTFDLYDNAPVGELAELNFEVSSEGFVWTKKISLKVAPPSTFELDQNFPNPFNPATNIRYRLPANMKVTVNVYNILGRKVMTLVDGQQQSAGQQTLRFDGSPLASGIYFFRITAQANRGNTITRLQKMTLIK